MFWGLPEMNSETIAYLFDCMNRSVQGCNSTANCSAYRRLHVVQWLVSILQEQLLVRVSSDNSNNIATLAITRLLRSILLHNLNVPNFRSVVDCIVYILATSKTGPTTNRNNVLKMASHLLQSVLDVVTIAMSNQNHGECGSTTMVLELIRQNFEIGGTQASTARMRPTDNKKMYQILIDGIYGVHNIMLHDNI